VKREGTRVLADLPEGKHAADEPPPPPGEEKTNHEERMDMKYLVRALVKYNASDLHLKAGRPPLYRINGKLIPARMPEMAGEHLERVVYSVLSDRQIRLLEEKKQIDLSFKVKDLGRFRANIYFQRGTVSAAIRMIPLRIPNIDELGIPPVIKELVQRPRGLLLITGATGSGKSTTLAALVQHINMTSHVHVLAIEDPIEFVYRDAKASITQRELGSDTHSLHEAMQAGLRQDPDVIMIGELRDKEMIMGALTAAETGHMVISTLHTNDAKSTIDRIVDVFPAEAKNQIRIQLGGSLVGVVSQQLIAKADGSGRVAACEVMVKSPTIEELILRNQIEKINETIASSSSYYKMQTMNQALAKLVAAGKISAEQALKSSYSPDDLRLQLSGFTREDGYAAEVERQGKPPLRRTG
jgi:twitching motility protein PilT